MLEEQNVYVVIIESGEYSDRLDWISAVFTSEDDAKAHIIKQAEERRQYVLAYDTWRAARTKAQQEIGPKIREQLVKDLEDFQARYDRMRSTETIEMERQAQRKINELLRDRIGDPPSTTAGDRSYLVTVPLNKPGEYCYT